MTRSKVYTTSSDESQFPIQTLEDVLEQIGGFGRFQALLLIFILFYEIPSGFLAFVPVFVAGVPKTWNCNDTSGGNITAMSSSEICSCDGEAIPGPGFPTIVTEWNLICDKAWLITAITTVQMIGMFFGNTIPPQISDWYGRKVTFLLLILLMAAGQSYSALARDPYTYAASRFICGLGLAGYFSLNGIYTMEFLTPKWRQLGGCLGPLGEGVALLGLLAYLIRPWRLLLWATTFPFITIVFIFPFLPESPRFLLQQKRYQEAANVLTYIAKVNGKAAPENLLGHLVRMGEEQDSNSPSVRYSYLDLFRRKAMRRKTFIFIGIWFCWAFTYFGLGYNLRNFRTNAYFLTVLMGLVDAVGFRAALLVNNRLGRRKALLLFTGTSSIFFAIVGVVQLLGGQTFIAIILLGRLCVAGTRSSIRVLTVESYPVAVRTMGFGISRVSAAVGGIAAPQIALLGEKWPAVPVFAFAALGFVGAILSLLLSETSGKPLEDELKDENENKGKY